MGTNRNLFRQTMLKKKNYKQNNYSSPQSSDHGMDTVFSNPNKNRGWPASLRNTAKSAKLTRLRLADLQTMFRPSRRLDSLLCEAAQNFEVS
jgi:hypothetical protein